MQTSTERGGIANSVTRGDPPHGSWADSSNGRIPTLHVGGSRFESWSVHRRIGSSRYPSAVTQTGYVPAHARVRRKYASYEPRTEWEGEPLAQDTPLNQSMGHSKSHVVASNPSGPWTPRPRLESSWDYTERIVQFSRIPRLHRGGSRCKSWSVHSCRLGPKEKIPHCLCGDTGAEPVGGVACFRGQTGTMPRC